MMSRKFQLKDNGGRILTVTAEGIKWDARGTDSRVPALREFKGRGFLGSGSISVPRERISGVTLVAGRRPGSGKPSAIFTVTGACQLTFSDVTVYTLLAGKHFNLTEMFQNMGYPVSNGTASTSAA